MFGRRKYLAKSLSRRRLLPSVVAGFALFLVLILLFITNPIHQVDPVTPNVSDSSPYIQKNVHSGLSLRLKIPSINVDAAVENVGLTAQGDMGVPKGPNNVAWYDLGPRPGEVGSSVIDGHFGWWKNGTPTVFNNLNKLQSGDKLYVKDKKGMTITFLVREIRTYGRNENHTSVFYSTDGKAHLNLITCEGVWNEAQKSFSNRLVVFADRE